MGDSTKSEITDTTDFRAASGMVAFSMPNTVESRLDRADTHCAMDAIAVTWS
jgi:hypothetical protein